MPTRVAARYSVAMNELHAYTAAQLAAALAARRRHYAKRCLVCHTPLIALALRRYCSNACRQKAKRRRAKEGTSG